MAAIRQMKNWYSGGALVLLAVLFIALTMLSGALLKGVRLDLTEHGLYTLNEGTVNLLRSLDEPVTLNFFFSEEASRELPQVRNYARRVQELLEEMALRSDDMLRVRRIDPRPFSEEEDEAARFGLEAVPVGAAGDSLYMGIAGTNLVDGVEVLPFLSPTREPFLEYELARMIFVLSRPDRPRVGLLSALPLAGGFDMRTQQRREPWAVHEQLDDLFEIEVVRPEADGLPRQLDALVVIHPRDLSEAMEYAIDQFVIGGGRLLAFVDPYAEADPGPDTGDPAAAFAMDRESALPALFTAWGLEFDRDRFVADPEQALQVSLEAGRPPVRHPGIVGVTRDRINRDDVVTGDLDSINLSSAGYLELSADSPLELTPLVESSPRAGLLPTERLRMLADPSELSAEVGSTGEPFVFAARLSGRVESAFPDHNDNEDHLDAGVLNAIVVADTDLLADRLWVQRQRFFGTVILSPFANNGDLAVNAVDNLLGNADLISVRSRAVSTRPFTLVDSLRREAEANLRATEQRLEAELRDTEQRLTELQQGRGDEDLMVLTPEQEAEIDRFIDQRLEIRRQLRQVRRDLDRDIETLGNRVKMINIALMPALVTVFALLLAWRRRRRQHLGQGTAA